MTEKSINLMTLSEARAERDRWQQEIDKATFWGAAVGAAAEFRDAAVKRIKQLEAVEDETK